MRTSRSALLVVALASSVALAACSPLPFPLRSQPQPQSESVTEEQPDDVAVEVAEVPERFLIVPDDYQAEYAGTAQDGRLFFIATPFVSGDDGNEFIATFFWNADGSYQSMDVDEFGARDTLDQAAWDASMQQHIDDLGDYTLGAISVAPFSAEAFGVEMGFVPQRYDGYIWISLLPGDYMAYTPPWDGLYDT